MASLTIRNIPDEAKHRFRQVAAAHGRSMEEHMRQLILASVDGRAASASTLREDAPSFLHREGQTAATPAKAENWVEELIRIANGAGEDVFDPEPQPLREFDL